MEGVIIRPMLPADPKDHRGMTYEWCKGRPGRQVTFCERNGGTVSGRHFHTGSDPSKRPEIMLHLHGTMKVRFCDGLALEEQVVVPFSEILVSPGIMHSYYADSEILFCEYRMTEYDREKPDTYFVEKFAEYLDARGKKYDPKVIEKFALAF